ncbi:LPXTG cell wall anchor domain-containing protein, partial [Streptococcus agalactiae]|nr:LPXTG cell wall anchor domain-containing protein [Streptococcus agalactiae]
DGVSPKVTVTPGKDKDGQPGHTITIQKPDGSTEDVFIKDGKDGKDGDCACKPEVPGNPEVPGKPEVSGESTLIPLKVNYTSGERLENQELPSTGESNNPLILLGALGLLTGAYMMNSKKKED